MIDRRSLIAGGIAAGTTLATAPALATATPIVAAPRLALWPGRPPGHEGVAVEDTHILRRADSGPDDIAWTHLANPCLKVTAAARPDARAVLLIPGGGYTRIAVGRASSDVARMFAASGVTAFELLYRLPHDGWAGGPAAPLQDAQRAVRLIRARAAAWRIDPARLIALGFSAGGHLAGLLGERAGTDSYAAIDAVDRQSARPLAIGMFFPVVTMTGPAAHAPSKAELLGPAPTDALVRAYSLESNVPASMPPTLVCHNADDATVAAQNSLSMFAALQAARIPSELMIAERGGHGPVLVPNDGPPHIWFELLRLFAARHGWAA